MTRIPWAIWKPAPSWKRGYGGTTWIPLNQKEGEVKHSMVGSYAAAEARLMGPDQASWHFSVLKDGTVFQHYEIEDITWHCGLPGDERHDTSLIGNITLIGVEHEGGAVGNVSEPFTAPQLDSTVRLSVGLRWLCLGYRRKPLAWKSSLWRHRFLSSTACDSFRTPEDLPARILAKEDDVALSPRQEQALEELAKLTLDPYTITLLPKPGQTTGDTATFPSFFHFLRAHSNAFDVGRMQWLDRKM